MDWKGYLFTHMHWTNTRQHTQARTEHISDFLIKEKSNIFGMRNIHLFENRLELTANLLATLVAQISCKNATGIYQPNHYHQKLSNTILRCGPRLYRKWNLESHCFRWELAQHAWKKVGRGIKNALCS